MLCQPGAGTPGSKSQDTTPQCTQVRLGKEYSECKQLTTAPAAFSSIKVSRYENNSLTTQRMMK